MHWFVHRFIFSIYLYLRGVLAYFVSFLANRFVVYLGEINIKQLLFDFCGFLIDFRLSNWCVDYLYLDFHASFNAF